MDDRHRFLTTNQSTGRSKAAAVTTTNHARRRRRGDASTMMVLRLQHHQHHQPHRLPMLHLLWLLVLLLLSTEAAFVGPAALRARRHPNVDSQWGSRWPPRAAAAAAVAASTGGEGEGEEQPPPSRAQGQRHHLHHHTRRRRSPDGLFLGNLTSPALMGWDVNIDVEEVRRRPTMMEAPPPQTHEQADPCTQP